MPLYKIFRERNHFFIDHGNIRKRYGYRVLHFRRASEVVLSNIRDQILPFFRGKEGIIFNGNFFPVERNGNRIIRCAYPACNHGSGNRHFLSDRCADVSRLLDRKGVIIPRHDPNRNAV